MADYSLQVEDLKDAAAICEKHTITTSVNGVNSEYPRWPNAWAACEIVWRNYLEMKTLDASDMDDRDTVIHEARKLR